MLPDTVAAPKRDIQRRHREKKNLEEFPKRSITRVCNDGTT